MDQTIPLIWGGLAGIGLAVGGICAMELRRARQTIKLLQKMNDRHNERIMKCEMGTTVIGIRFRWMEKH